MPLFLERKQIIFPFLHIVVPQRSDCFCSAKGEAFSSSLVNECFYCLTENVSKRRRIRLKRLKNLRSVSGIFIIQFSLLTYTILYISPVNTYFPHTRTQIFSISPFCCYETIHVSREDFNLETVVLR